MYVTPPGPDRYPKKLAFIKIPQMALDEYRWLKVKSGGASMPRPPPPSVGTVQKKGKI